MVILALGWIGLIYGLYEDYLSQKRFEECENCWNFSDTGILIMSLPTIVGLVLIGIGGALVAIGRRVLGKKV
jgi:hypothetical protein